VLHPSRLLGGDRTLTHAPSERRGDLGHREIRYE
jgi:hypothetical protein